MFFRISSSCLAIVALMPASVSAMPGMDQNDTAQLNMAAAVTSLSAQESGLTPPSSGMDEPPRPLSVPGTEEPALSDLPLSYDIRHAAHAKIANLLAVRSDDAPIGLGAAGSEAHHALSLSSAALSSAASGPTLTDRWTVHHDNTRYRAFGAKLGAIKWEVAALAAFYTARYSSELLSNPIGFHFTNEGWFGKNTYRLGLDKLTHTYNTYIMSEFLHARLHQKTGATAGDAVSAAVMASGFMLYAEMFDAINPHVGFSWHDIVMNTAGAGFSVLRNTIPGLRDTLDYRLLLIPNSDIYTPTGKRHYRQMRYLLALQLGGFKAFEQTPLRFAELHLGYYATGFTSEELARGERPKRHVFFGVGLNLRRLLFPEPRSTVKRAAHSALRYVQIPYTAVHDKF